MPSVAQVQAGITRITIMNEMEAEVKEENVREDSGTHTVSVSTAYITSVNQRGRSDKLEVKFEGFDIRSDLLPILQNIWSIHGNIVENSIIRNGDLIAKALESLANVILILKGNSVRSLNDCQIDYLSATLSDLSCIRFKVDWLVPCVEKTIELHKSKPLLYSLNKLGQTRSQAAERRLKLLGELDELDKLEKTLQEDMENVSRKLPFNGDVDLDQILGGGLP
ncbi:uncharacterized protein [Spinacia oleracea]|uniref:Uncharacterized protein n=1 Tax=Spinacia oleracea TaxID=3562 RepID=A0ABM3QSJ7_SPIOL|nr:uncharacterized protein LOC130462024 [Spinacia oleracea]